VDNVPELVIREATLRDEADLLRMMRNLASHEPGAIPFDESAARAAFRQFLSLPAFGRVWLLCENTKPAGYIILTLGFSFEFHGHDAFIDELYVELAYRRRGYGRQAIDFIEKKAGEIDVHALHLEVDHGNDPAIELYRRAGYVDHQRHLMTKWLETSKAKGSP
jgi:ribosomal protein S18 acetylase RimI-like enzyme